MLECSTWNLLPVTLTPSTEREAIGCGHGCSLNEGTKRAFVAGPHEEQMKSGQVNEAWSSTLELILAH
jgi:hypothetical protein